MILILALGLIAAEPLGYVCGRAAEPIRIDGRLDDAAWQAAPWTDPFVDIEGDRKPRPRFRTRAKMLWDDQYFYIAAEMEEPHVWATITKHDEVIFHDNDFEVFIDPDGDNHEYYELEINANNAEWDLFLKKPYRDGGPAINEWEVPGLKTAVHIDGTLNDPGDTDRGWSVEWAIPWSVLAEYAHRPSPPRDGDQWRVNFSRVEWVADVVDGRYRKRAGLKEDNWVWSPQGVIDMHQPEHWGYVQFSEQPPGRAEFRPDPTRPAREALRRIYQAQRALHAKERRWASSLAELGFDPVELARGLAGPPTLEPTPDGYRATAEVAGPDPSRRRLSMGEDSRIREP
jgi:hypothetical protein